MVISLPYVCWCLSDLCLFPFLPHTIEEGWAAEAGIGTVSCSDVAEPKRRRGVQRTDTVPALSGSSSALRSHLNIQQLDFPMEMTSLDFQFFSRARNVPMMFTELSRNIVLFKGIAGVSE